LDFGGCPLQFPPLKTANCSEEALPKTSKNILEAYEVLLIMSWRGDLVLIDIRGYLSTMELK
jgi:hypothetical protein